MVDKELISLEEYEKQRAKEEKQLNNQLENGIPLGIACPVCKEELWGDVVCSLMSNPPQRHIWCPVCGYTGFSH